MNSRRYLFAVGLLAAPAVRAQEAVTAFEHVSVIPMDRERVLEGQTVVVRGDRIVAIGPARRVAVPKGARRIDGHGKYLIPGLADVHTHVMFHPGDRFAHNLLLFLANGITTIRNVDYGDYGREAGSVTYADMFRMRARAAAGGVWSPRIFMSGRWRADTAVSVDTNIARYKAAGYDFVKIHPESPAVLDSVAAAARRYGLGILGHVEHDFQHALDLGFTSTEHLLGYDTLKLAEQIAALRRTGTWTTPTLAHLRWAGIRSPLERRYLPLELAILFKRDTAYIAELLGAPTIADGPPLLVDRIVRAVYEGGAGLLAGSHAPSHYAGAFAIHHELAAFVAAGLTPYAALLTATRNPASHLGILHEAGTIAVGKRADLVLVNGNPLADIRNAADNAGVMIGGRWLSGADIDTKLSDDYVRAMARRVEHDRAGGE